MVTLKQGTVNLPRCVRNCAFPQLNSELLQLSN
jgi:hypothetical protein